MNEAATLGLVWTSFFRKRATQAVLWILFTALAALLLTATMYWTLFDPQWVIFLSGIVIAGVLATVSQASRAEWRLVRRRLETSRLRARLGEESARSHHAMEAFRTSQVRLRLLGDALPWPAFILDSEEVCRFHNSAAATALCLPVDRIDGHPLREILGEADYAEMKPHIAASPSGEAGTCVVLGPGAATRPAAAPASTPGHDFLVPDEHGDMLYMHAIVNELTGWDDPKKKLLDALREDRFLLLTQRILPLDIGADALCFEVLLRLKEEEDNLLPPGGFLPVAERYGMMEDLDRWVVRRLVSHCLDKRRADPQWRAPLHCINLSKPAIASEAFARFVQDQISHRGFDGHALCFEICEADVIAGRDEVRKLIAALKPLGCRFTVDGFGSASGSFAPLKGLAFDFLKIDGVIVQNMLRDPAALAKLKAVNAVCHKIGLRTIAEFVEDNETFAALHRIGVDYVQGFGIARPERLIQEAAAPLLPVAA